MSGEVVQLDDYRNTHGKGALYDAAVEMSDLDPEVKEVIDARESLVEKICGMNLKDLFIFDPAMRVKVFDKRRNPDDYIDEEDKPLLQRVEAANDNAAPQVDNDSVIPQKEAA